ncbi:hypothetical protein ACFWIZ_38205, partial [Streptomyces sp. NPDC127044]
MPPLPAVTPLDAAALVSPLLPFFAPLSSPPPRVRASTVPITASATTTAMITRVRRDTTSVSGARGAGRGGRSGATGHPEAGLASPAEPVESEPPEPAEPRAPFEPTGPEAEPTGAPSRTPDFGESSAALPSWPGVTVPDFAAATAGFDTSTRGGAGGAFGATGAAPSTPTE